MRLRKPHGIAAVVVARLGAFLLGAALCSAVNAEDEFVYHARRGDTLIGIGRQLLAEPRHWREVARLNRLRDPDFILPQQAIRIPVHLLRGEPAPGQVLHAVGGARLIAPGSAAVPAEAGAPVEEGTQVVTGDDGYVTIRLADGSTLRVQAGSHAQVTQARAVGAAGHRSALRVLGGRLESLVTQVKGGSPRFEVRTPQAAIAVRGTEFRVAVNGSQTRSEVLSGTVDLAAPPASAGGASPTTASGFDRGTNQIADQRVDRPAAPPLGAAAARQAITAGFASAVDAAGKVAPPVALLAAPDVASLPPLQERLLVRFIVPAVTGAAGYRAQVALDRDFAGVAGAVVTTAPELRFADLADADYFLRVRAIDAAGFEGHDAVHAFRLKARPEPPTPAGPPPQSKLPAQRVDFAWTQNPQAARYRFQLARDAQFASPLRSEDAFTGAELAIEGLGPGTYFWRLASVRADGDRGPWGDAQQFELRALPPPLAPPAIGDAAIRLAWGGSPGQTFDFQLARDEAFADLLLARTLDEPTVEFARPAHGKYYVRYRARDPDGYIGPFTSAQTIDLPNCVRAGSGGCVVSGGGPLRAQ